MTSDDHYLFFARACYRNSARLIRATCSHHDFTPHWLRTSPAIITSPGCAMPMLLAAPILLILALCLPLNTLASERSPSEPAAAPARQAMTNPAENKTANLPRLENTAQSDRLLLQEVSDRHIFLPDESQSRTGHTSKLTSGRQQGEVALSAWELVLQSTRIKIPVHKQVSDYRAQYGREAIWISQILERATPFIGHVVDELDKRYLPLELALLPAIESGYQPDVHSPENAAGIWQIIPSTAADVGIEHTPWFDGRSDIYQSTSAALGYLSYLNAEFHGDWLLTLAAYNAGLGRVRTALKRNRQSGLPVDFWSLKLPHETRQYVPKFLALVAMLRYDKPAGLTIPSVPRGSAFDLVDARQRIELASLAALTGLPEVRLRLLNAGLVREITPPAGPHLVYVPQGYGASLVEKLSGNHERALSSPAGTHKVVAGDTINTVARRYSITPQRLRQLNELESDIIRINQTLWVHNADTGVQRVEYVVSIGDTLSDIAERFSMRIDNIRDAQGQQLTDDVIHPGQRLSLLTPSHSSARQ